ncbi:uncharacterized protein A1O9_13155, partial [Exophiala aquamarina CBS 119918]
MYARRGGRVGAYGQCGQRHGEDIPALRVGLMVGIGGGIPNLAKGIDIRLGDIVTLAQLQARHGMRASKVSDYINDCKAPHNKRKPRKNRIPVTHYGVIASGNQVVKDATVRDRLRDEFGALCVEVEAAGLVNDFPCLVIRGICDYADAHKNEGWHAYAAMTAASYAKEFLQYISPTQMKMERPLQDIVGKYNLSVRIMMQFC